MEIEFYKYQGAGNDFILIDDRNEIINRKDVSFVRSLCDRRFGIGGDGLMLLRNHSQYDFEMIYFNSDGREASMCGNGGRCIVAFAHKLKIVNKQTRFMAVDGVHDAVVSKPEYIQLKMIDVDNIEQGDNYSFLNTGSPHYVVFNVNLDDLDIINAAHAIRYNDRFKDAGTNVNFIQSFENYIRVRTYERGVENETLACGTGVVASAISAFLKGDKRDYYPVKVEGGELGVRFTEVHGKFVDVWLEGPANFVFKGIYS